MTVHMHSTVMRFIDALGTAAQKRRYFGEVVRDGKLFGSWGSEPAVSLSRTFLMETAVRQDGDAYVVDGVKHFCTMALGASHYMVWCALDGGTDMGKALLLVLVPADAPGIATDGKWDTLGHARDLQPVGDLHRRARARRTRRSATRAPASRSASWRASRSATPRSTSVSRRARSPSRSTTPRSASSSPRTSRSPTIPPCSGTSGELSAHLDAALLVLADTAARWEAADLVERGVLANRAKYLATEVGLEVTSRVIQVVGGPRRLQGVPGRARLPRPPHLDPDAPDDGPHARRHRQEPPSGSRALCSRSQANNPERAAARQLQGEAKPKASRTDTRNEAAVAWRGAAEGEPNGYKK